MWASEGVLALALAKTSPPLLSTHRQVRCYWPRRHVRDHTGHTTRWSIDWGDRFSSEEYRDEGEEERVEGAGEESIGSLEDTGHWLSSSRKSDSSALARLNMSTRFFSWKQQKCCFFNSSIQTVNNLFDTNFLWWIRCKNEGSGIGTFQHVACGCRRWRSRLFLSI